MTPRLIKIRLLVFLVPRCLGLLAVSAAELSTATELQRFEYFRIQMGTRVRIVLYAADETRAREAASAAFERIRQLDEIMTDYNPESELMRLSRAGHRSPQSVSRDLFNVLEKSLEFSKLSHGAFDVTVGPLVTLWRQARRSMQLPDEKALVRARRSVGYSNVILERRSRTVYLRRFGMKLDLGGIGKGYAADKALAVLNDRGIRSALVAAGGDIRTSAAPPGQPGWRVSIQDPNPLEYPEGKELILHDCGVSTSGDTEQFVQIRGVRYSHIVDPRSGLAVRDSASVTVVAPDATIADALATSLSVLPQEEGLRLVESQKGVAACIIRRTGSKLRTYASRRMKQYLAKTEAQTTLSWSGH